MKRNGKILKTNAQRYALIGACFGLMFPILAALIRTIGSGIPLSIPSIWTAYSSDPLLWIIATAPLFLGLFAAVAGRRQDELEGTNNALTARERELDATRLFLEQQVNERTHELTTRNQVFLERARLLNAVVETSRSLLATLGLDPLLPMIVQTIGLQFNFSHVAVYLLDAQKQHALLMASSSESGRQMMQHGQKPGLGRQSLIEFAIRSGQVQIVKNSPADPKSGPDSELGGARVELVLPLTSGQGAIGALDFHVDRETDFTEEYVSILRILADLVTIAVQNSILYDKTQQTLRESEFSLRQTSVREWSSWVESGQARGYRYDGLRAEPIQESEPSDPTQKRIQSVPIRLRGRTIGNLHVKLTESTPDWTEDDRAIAEAAAERAALALEAARLLEEAKRSAAREAFLSDMAAKLGASFRLDSILRDTVEELGRSLENSTVSFQVVDPSTRQSVRSRPETPMRPRDQE